MQWSDARSLGDVRLVSIASSPRHARPRYGNAEPSGYQPRTVQTLRGMGGPGRGSDIVEFSPPYYLGDTESGPPTFAYELLSVFALNNPQAQRHRCAAPLQPPKVR